MTEKLDMLSLAYLIMEQSRLRFLGLTDVFQRLHQHAVELQLLVVMEAKNLE